MLRIQHLPVNIRSSMFPRIYTYRLMKQDQLSSDAQLYFQLLLLLF